ncbi:hypothetical protein [Vulcanisaeta distributa]|uniref:hypothetical protein n=1 Tax=Vulcanisaeta distributa TaxID=164451 RepID=UPI001FB43713|nr:hypothetical protein [Vulcanisaeta distributa]
MIVWPSPLIVSVVDNPGAEWLITWPNGTANGYSTTTFKIYATGPTTLNAYVTGVPPGYETCSITPSQATASPGAVSDVPSDVHSTTKQLGGLRQQPTTKQQHGTTTGK